MNNFSIINSKKLSPTCKIGPFCLISDNAEISDRTVLESHVVIGKNSQIGADTVIKNGTSVGDNVVIAQKVLIGSNATLFPNISIEQGAIIGAGAVVTKSVPPYAIVVGVPAKLVGYVPSPLNTGSNSLVDEKKISKISGNKKLHVGDSEIFEFPYIKDLRGNLSVGEFEKNIPFIPKRYFLVFDVPATKLRGEHAHRKCKQFLICVAGKCSVLVDDGSHRAEVELSEPNMGIYIPPMIWGVQHNYSKDAVLLVFASDFYDSNDYIRNYSEFVQLTKKTSTN